jgi:uncharacterized protein (TIGR03083 family)
MTETSADTSRLSHRDSMALGATEYKRFVELIGSLGPHDWARPTDCSLWDVKAVVAHNLGNMDGNASIREMARQTRIATKRAKAAGTTMIDEMTALQIAERSALTPAELISRVHRVAPKALAGRRRVPAAMRKAVKISLPQPWGPIRLGYLIDQIYNRDMWMHRIDICRATGREMAVDRVHDGRIVAEIVGDWAANHGQPFHLQLDGPAGGDFHRGDGGEQVRLDAVEFCRIVSGRGDRGLTQGLLATEVLY